MLGMMITAVGVSLPDFQDGIGNRLAVAIQHAALNRDSFTRASFAEIRSVHVLQADTEERTDSLRRRGMAGHSTPHGRRLSPAQNDIKPEA